MILFFSKVVLILCILKLNFSECSAAEESSPILLEVGPDLLASPGAEIFELKKNLMDKRAAKLRLTKEVLSLPRSLIPIQYKIRIRPILETKNVNELFTAPGSVLIIFRCRETTDSITLHARIKDSLQINENSVKIELRNNARNGSNEPITPLEHLYDEKDTDFYKILLTDPLEKGKEYSVFIEFISKIQTKSLHGLYLSTYKDPVSSHEKYLAVTQFEDISARKMFPCFDEPDLKASFQISVSRLGKHSSMSNMAMDQTEPDSQNPGYFLDHYPPTPIMSSYLVALVVSEFLCFPAPNSIYYKPVEACGPKHLIEDQNGGTHAAKVSAEILKYYEELFDQKYPFPKMQSVAIPDFEAGAMENYGLNTYRINALLYFPGKTTELGRKRIETVIAHELAHQNFGNFVTTKTWNHVVMNEGFAEFVSYIGAQKVGPEFRGDKNWQVGYFQRALKRDAMADTHPVVKLNAFFGDFDAITYAKGASLIKMMERLLTYDTLIKGLRKYLASYSFGNADFRDLLRVLETQAHEDKTHPQFAPINEIMENWFVQPGFPLIRVYTRFDSPHQIYVSQERFRNQNPDGKHSIQNNETFGNSNPLWFCPIFISTRNGLPSTHVPDFWLTSKQSHMTWEIPLPSAEWIIVNPDSAGFFRVHYDKKMSSAINYQLNENPHVFSAISRIQLVDDAFELAWAQYSTIDEALDHTTYLSQEADADVWLTVLSHFNKIIQMFSENNQSLHKLSAYLNPKIEKTLSAIGVEQLPSDKGEIVIFRKSLLAWGGSVGVPSVIQYAKQLIEVWKTNTSYIPIPVDIQEEIFCTAVRHGDMQDSSFVFEQYLQYFNNDDDEDKKLRLLNALSCSNDAETLRSFRQKTIKPGSEIEASHGFILLQKLMTNSLLREETFWFIRQNFDDILSHFNTNPAKVVVTFTNLLSHYWNTRQKLKLMKEFISEHKDELNSSKEILNQALSKVESNIRWMENHGSAIDIWMSRQDM